MFFGLSSFIATAKMELELNGEIVLISKFGRYGGAGSSDREIRLYQNGIALCESTGRVGHAFAAGGDHFRARDLSE